MPRTRALAAAAISVAILLWQPAVAGDPPAEVMAALDRIVPNIPPDKIQESALPGLYEVSYGPSVVYVSADGRYLIQGDMVELESGRNFSRDRRWEHRRETMRRVGERDVVTFGPENARYTVDVFTDIDCPYCVRLHSQMADYNRLGIRIRYLAFPRAGPRSSSADKWVSVWCAEDKQTAMTMAKSGQHVPQQRCENPVAEQFSLGRAVGVRGTPSLIFESGRMIPGYVPPDELLEMLEESESG